MQAVIAHGGKQYVINEGDEIRVEWIHQEPGADVTISDVLMVDNGKGSVQVGRPFVEGASVQALVMAEDREPKILVMRRKRRKGMRRVIGHRQHYTALKIVKINTGA